VKAVCPSRSGVSDDTARLAFRVDEQLGARADAAPLRWHRSRPTAWPGAQFTSKPPEIFGVVFRHPDGHPSQPGGLCGSGRGRRPLISERRGRLSALHRRDADRDGRAWTHRRRRGRRERDQGQRQRTRKSSDV